MRQDAIEGTSGSVSSEEELRAALARGLTPITLTGCFSIKMCIRDRFLDVCAALKGTKYETVPVYTCLLYTSRCV